MAQHIYLASNIASTAQYSAGSSRCTGIQSKISKQSNEIACTTIRFIIRDIQVRGRIKRDKGACHAYPLPTCGSVTSHHPQKREPPLLQYRRRDNEYTNSVHLADELVNVCFPVTEVTALDVMLELAYPPAAGGVGELERPQEVRDLLEVGASGENFVHEILNGENVIFA